MAMRSYTLNYLTWKSADEPSQVKSFKRRLELDTTRLLEPLPVLQKKKVE